MGSKEVFLKEDIVWAFETFIGQLKSSEAIHPQTIRVVERLKSQIVEIVPTHENGSPWHTGTPTEDGLYAVYYLDDNNPSATPYEVLYDGFLSPDGEGNWIDRDGERRFIDDDIVRWKKIEPYKEGKTNE